ncbi:hypothetical protein F5B20DRAFT_550467 [Whalleya microplaca]|nr:hypothetical protein F5B20DRAFT_550467 [Whalleya microplaca]
MDAVGTAIGLAGTVLKLVVFSIDFVTDAKQVYHNSATDQNLDLATVANSIQNATSSLESQLQDLSDDGEKRGLDPDEKELRSLALRAAEIGNELAESLKKVQIEEKSKWKSFKVVVRSRWDAEDLQKTEKRLHGIRDEIQLRILIGIRKKVNGSNDEDHRRKLEGLEEIAQHQTQGNEHIMNTLAHMDDSGKERHNEIVRLLIERNGTTSGESSPAPTEGTPQKPYNSGTRNKAEDIILDSLWYASIRDREESIEKAYVETLEWIFEDPKVNNKTWGNFVDFLEGDSRLYWITGKPGSGKSTLMKFINGHPRTKDHLAQWSGNKDILEASFYFFYNGSDYQKSELGMLQTLLYSLLSQRRDLIPLAFKERFRAALEAKRHACPTLPEVKMAFKQLLLGSADLHFFFSIDGLDEFDPKVSLTNVTSLIAVTKMLSTFPNAKVLVSSRPLAEFGDAFTGCPCLSVHHLTRDDIKRYATEKLESHRRMQMLLKRDPLSAKRLLESIVSLSAGVFLWVRLVTESLLSGLTNYDNINDLQHRLEELPSDIYDLYKTMLSRVEPKYRSQTAQLLELVREGTRGSRELSILGLWFAEQADHSMVLSTEVKPIDDDTYNDRVNEMESRLKSRCLGLVEIQPTRMTQKTLREHLLPPSDIYDLSTDSRKATAGFLHRSVFEFLSDDHIRQSFIETYCHPNFNAPLSLLRSSILILKSFKDDNRGRRRILLMLVLYVGYRARDSEYSTKQSNSILLHELDSTVSKHLTTYADVLDDSWGDEPGSDLNWCNWLYHFYPGFYSLDQTYIPSRFQPRDWHSSFLVFAVHFDLEFYLREQIAVHGQGIIQKEGMPLLGHALCAALSRPVHYPIPHHEIVEFLLENGSNLQQTYHNKTAWGWFLHSLRAEWDGLMTICPFWVQFPNFMSAMKTMIVNGADPNIPMRWKERGRMGNETACTLLLALIRIRKALSTFCNSQEVQFIQNHRNIPSVEEIEDMIQILKDHGGVEREWPRECLYGTVEPEDGSSEDMVDLNNPDGKVKDITRPPNETTILNPSTPISSSPEVNCDLTRGKNTSPNQATAKDTESTIGTTKSRESGETDGYVPDSGKKVIVSEHSNSQSSSTPLKIKNEWKPWHSRRFNRLRSKLVR